MDMPTPGDQEIETVAAQGGQDQDRRTPHVSYDNIVAPSSFKKIHSMFSRTTIYNNKRLFRTCRQLRNEAEAHF